MPLNEITSEFSKTVAFGVALKRHTKNNAETSVTERGSVAYSVLQAQIHHLAEMQVVEIDVSVERRSGEECEHTHGGEHFRVGHQRQVNQAFD